MCPYAGVVTLVIATFSKRGRSGCRSSSKHFEVWRCVKWPKANRPTEILRSICLELEKILTPSVVGVTMLDRSLQTFEEAVFPSLPAEYADALKGIAVADKPGTCALAVFKGQTVISKDVLNDSRFSDGWKTLGVTHGLRALVSIPAIGPRGLTLGTLVVTFEPGTTLSTGSRKLAEAAAELCGLVLRYRRTQMKNELLLGELQHRMRNLFGAVGAIVHATARAHPDRRGIPEGI